MHVAYLDFDNYSAFRSVHVQVYPNRRHLCNDINNRRPTGIFPVSEYHYFNGLFDIILAQIQITWRSDSLTGHKKIKRDFLFITHKSLSDHDYLNPFPNAASIVQFLPNKLLHKMHSYMAAYVYLFRSN